MNEIPQWMMDEVAEYDLEMSPAPGTILDIGANIGAFALACHKKWPEAVIQCYEPVARNYAQLGENIAHVLKSKAHPFAVRSFTRREKILLGDRGVTCSFYQLGRQRDETERVMCIDAADLASADLVKVDTEGCEVEIVSRLNLARTRALVVEYHRAQDAGLLKTIAVSAGFALLDEKKSGETWGVLKFGREGVTLPEGTKGTGSQSLVTSSPTQLKERKIYVGVAAHFSNHDLIFIQSMMQLLLRPFVRMDFGWSCDPSVERARNILTANFLASDCTHILFIDADIGFMPQDAARIVSHEADVVGGIYPLKTMAPAVTWCGNAVNCIGKDDAPVGPGGLQEVGCIGTGFMCISRRAFERIIEVDGPRIAYVQDLPPYREEFAFWRQEVREVGGRRRFLTEDWNFCYRWHALGGAVYADTQVILRHAGRAVWPLELQQGNPFVRNEGTKGTPGTKEQ